MLICRLTSCFRPSVRLLQPISRLHYEQGQSPKPNIREYFYYIDHQGQVSIYAVNEVGLVSRPWLGHLFSVVYRLVAVTIRRFAEKRPQFSSFCHRNLFSICSCFWMMPGSRTSPHASKVRVSSFSSHPPTRDLDSFKTISSKCLAY